MNPFDPESDAPRVAKQVIIIRKDLKMRTGKACSQAAHASMGALLYLAAKLDLPATRLYAVSIVESPDSAVAQWLKGSFTKITVYVESEEELKVIHAAALAAKLPTALIEDNGKTEFHGVKTATAVAIGPAWADQIDPITKHLPLL